MSRTQRHCYANKISLKGISESVTSNKFICRKSQCQSVQKIYIKVDSIHIKQVLLGTKPNGLFMNGMQCILIVILKVSGQNVLRSKRPRVLRSKRPRVLGSERPHVLTLTKRQTKCLTNQIAFYMKK